MGDAIAGGKSGGKMRFSGRAGSTDVNLKWEQAAETVEFFIEHFHGVVINAFLAMPGLV